MESAYAAAAELADGGDGMKNIQTGQLRHRVTVKKRAVVPEQFNELGNDLVQDVVVGTYWANIESRTGSLLKGRTAGTMLADTTHVITMRYHQDVDHACWIEFQGRKFDIDYVNDPDFTKTWMQIYVREVMG